MKLKCYNVKKNDLQIMVTDQINKFKIQLYFTFDPHDTYTEDLLVWDQIHRYNVHPQSTRVLFDKERISCPTLLVFSQGSE